MLRNPVPRTSTLASVWAELTAREEDADLARRMGLDASPLMIEALAAAEEEGKGTRRASGGGGGEGDDDGGGGGGGGSASVVSASASPARLGSDEEAERALLQTLCWCQMMRDDPLRLLRALRFSATLGFALHASFWVAAPFALLPGGLELKVSHTRKLKELRKVARSGSGRLVDFFGTVLEPPVASWYGAQGGGGVSGGQGAAAAAAAAAVGSRGRADPTHPRAFRDALFGVSSTAAACGGGGGGGSSSSGGGGATMRLGRFDGDKARAVAAYLPAGISEDATLGAVLAASLLSCGVVAGGEDDDGGLAGSAGSGGRGADRRQGAEAAATTFEEAEATSEAAATSEGGGGDGASSTLVAPAAAALATALHEVEQACDGLRAPTAMRQAAVEPLAVATRLLEPLEVTGLHQLFAQAAGERLGGGGSGGGAAALSVPRRVAPAAAAEGDATPASYLSSLSPASSPDGIARAHDFAMMVRVWELLKLDPSNAKRQLEVGPRFALALLGMPSAETSAIASQLEAHVELLMRTGAGPTALPGAAVAGLPEVPPHMRGTLIGMVHVLCRIRNESPELETPAQLRSYLQGECDGLLAKLAGEFWAVEHFERGEDGEPRWVGKELREAYRVKRG